MKCAGGVAKRIITLRFMESLFKTSPYMQLLISTQNVTKMFTVAKFGGRGWENKM